MTLIKINLAVQLTVYKLISLQILYYPYSSNQLLITKVGEMVLYGTKDLLRILTRLMHTPFDTLLRISILYSLSPLR